MKVLLLGGYGVFGGRLAELLSDIADLDIVISGRSLAKARAFCRAYQGPAKATPLALDRNDLADHIDDLAPDIVVDASGPFQDYGADPYVVVKTCIRASVHYLDFADAADFVFGISQFDDAAKKAGVFALSGASSFPVLTAAVLRHMARDMDIVSVTGGLAPSPYAGIGMNVMRAVAGYAGGPVRLYRNGVVTTATGLAETRRFTISPPGRLPLRNVLFSLVDVPDLQVIPPEHETLTDIWIGAGPVPEFLHRILILLARARAAFRLPSLEPLSPVFHGVLNLMKFGEHRGGMFVHATGIRDGEPQERSWHLLAEGDDGPYIPSMAIEALLRKFRTGDAPQIGARPATRALELSDYDALFASKAIYTGFRTHTATAQPLYRQILGEAFDSLPKALRTLHDLEAEKVWTGRATVKRGPHPAARLVARLFGFPPASEGIDVSVTLTPRGTGERWFRNFGGARMVSTQAPGRGRNSHLLVERFGPVSVAMALVVKNHRLVLIPRRWTLFGVPLPRFLLPSGETYEFEADGRFHFHVTIQAPWIGLIVAYKGWLEPNGSAIL